MSCSYVQLKYFHLNYFFKFLPIKRITFLEIRDSHLNGIWTCFIPTKLEIVYDKSCQISLLCSKLVILASFYSTPFYHYCTKILINQELYCLMTRSIGALQMGQFSPLFFRVLAHLIQQQTWPVFPWTIVAFLRLETQIRHFSESSKLSIETSSSSSSNISKERISNGISRIFYIF